MHELIVKINGFLWGNFLITLLVGTGIYFTISLKFIQIRKFGVAVKKVTGGFSLSGEEAGASGMSSFQALATAIAAQVGTGNLAGAATAIAAGGPGAIFWMWVSAFFGMATVFGEAILGQVYKTTVNGQVTGGPAYYIEKALPSKEFSKFLSYFFAFACILALGLMGNSVQSNSIAVAFKEAFGVPQTVVGIVLAGFAGIVFFGGLKRIAAVTEKIVPIMAALYLVACLFIVVTNLDKVGPAIGAIFSMAFDPKAAFGGLMGVSIKQAVRYGVARGLFSNEAGMGSTPHAHAIARVKHPGEQGAVALITVFIDTFIVLTGTALVILTSGVPLTSATGIQLTQKSFQASLGGIGYGFVAFCLFFFAFSTIVGWYFFGEANIRYIFKSDKAINVYRFLVMFMILFGSMLKVGIAWELADMFNALMVLPNLIGLLALRKVIKEKTEEFERL